MVLFIWVYYWHVLQITCHSSRSLTHRKAKEVAMGQGIFCETWRAASTKHDGNQFQRSWGLEFLPLISEVWVKKAVPPISWMRIHRWIYFWSHPCHFRKAMNWPRNGLSQHGHHDHHFFFLLSYWYWCMKWVSSNSVGVPNLRCSQIGETLNTTIPCG